LNHTGHKCLMQRRKSRNGEAKPSVAKVPVRLRCPHHAGSPWKDDYCFCAELLLGVIRELVILDPFGVLLCCLERDRWRLILAKR
jgi:hypothetical protein